MDAAGWRRGGRAPVTEFAVILFAGLVIFQLFGEAINRAPGLVLGNVNYVKKIVFALEILPVVALSSALFDTLVSMTVLFSFVLLVMGACR